MNSYRVEVNGDVFYYEDERKIHFHREDGPAVEYANGNRYWYKHGKIHREDGPAVELNGICYWCVDGVRYTTEKEFIYRHCRNYKNAGELCYIYP